MSAAHPRRWEIAFAAIGYAVLLAWLGWPLVAHPASALVDPEAWGDAGSLWGRADLDLLVWIVAWTAHAVAAQPLAIFQANLFYPAADTLASSEHLLGLLPVTGPTFWISQNAVLTYNVAILAVIWTGAFTMFLLGRAWSGRASAAFLAGALFALGGTIPLGFVRLHSSAIHLYPLVLLLAWRSAERPRARTWAGLALTTALQVLSGIYVAFGLAALAAAVAPSLVTHARRHGNSGLAPLSALAVGALPLALVAGPYLRMQASGVLPDPTGSLAVVATTSGTARGLAGILYREITPLGLVLAGIGLAWRRGAVGVRGCLVSLAVVGWLLSLGSNGRLPGFDLPSLYEILMAAVPGFSGMRAPQRFLYLTQLALCALVALGGATIVDAVMRRGGARAARAAGVGLVALAAASVPQRTTRWPVPLRLDPQNGLYVGAHAWLAAHAQPGPVLDLPAQISAVDSVGLHSTGRAMLGSTLHWYPLLNGYSGYPPRRHVLTMTLAQRLPDAQALHDLCEVARPRWIVVHQGLLHDQDAWRAAEARLPIHEVHRRGLDTIYEVQCPTTEVHSDWTHARALPESARRASLSVEIPEVHANDLVRLWADVTNRGDRPWPGLRPSGSGGVVLRTRWYDAGSGEILSEDPPLPLARDLAPGETVRAQIEAVAPSPGSRVLEIEIAQEGEPPFRILGDTAHRPVHVLPPTSVPAAASSARPGDD